MVLNIHVRRAGLKQPSVEVRFENLTLSSMVPEGAGTGMFTVAKDIKFKALVSTLSPGSILDVPFDFKTK